MAHIGQPRPDSGLGFHVKSLMFLSYRSQYQKLDYPEFTPSPYAHQVTGQNFAACVSGGVFGTVLRLGFPELPQFTITLTWSGDGAKLRVLRELATPDAPATSPKCAAVPRRARM